MRILHVSDRLTGRGGAYWHLLGVVSHQLPHHDVHLACGVADRHVEAPCAVTEVPGLEAREAASVDVAEILRTFAPDVVHVHNVVNPAALRSLGAARGARGVVTVQDHRVFCPGKGKWTLSGHVCREPMSTEICRDCFTDEPYFEDIVSLTKARLEALADFEVVVLSRYMREELVAVGLPPSSVHVIPPFVHGLDLQAAPASPPCVLFVGRLVASKGPHDALEAWRLSGLEIPIVFAGAGPLRPQLPEGEHLGWVPHARMASVYRRARVLVMPSRWQEPFGLAGLEALTMGTPVAAWESGGVSDWHPGPGLVPWGDIESLAASLASATETRVEPPRGFEPERLMGALESVYRGVSPGAPEPR